MKRIFFTLFIFVFFNFSIVYSMEEKKGLIYQKFKMYPGKESDPYTLVYPVEVTGPGKLRVYVQTKKGNGKISFSLVDIRAFEDKKDDKKWWQEWLNKANKYHFIEWVDGDKVKNYIGYLRKTVNHFLGKKEKAPKWFYGYDFASVNNNGRIEINIDDMDLKNTEGRYVVMLNNRNNEPIEGTILIDFPGDMFEVERDLWESDPNKTDLVVKEISLNRSNQIMITVSKDRGWMPDGLWKLKDDKAVIIRINVGEKVFNIPLSVFDPQMKLKYGEVIYTITEFELTNEENVTVFIDATNQVAERSKANNKMSVILKPKIKEGSAREKKT